MKNIRPCIALVITLFVFGSTTPLIAQRPLFNERIPELLRLNEDQIKVRQQLIKEYFDADVLIVGGKLRYEKEVLNAKFVECLNAEQRRIYEQYTVFSSSGAQWSVDLIRKASFLDELNLSANQKEKLDDIKKELDSSESKMRSDLAAKEKEQDQTLHSNFEKILLPFQRNLIKSHLGKPIDFDKSGFAGDLINYRSFATEPNEKVSFAASHFPSLIFMVPTAKNVEPPLRYIPLVAMLSEKIVADELNMNENQKEQIQQHKKDVDKILKDFSDMEFSFVEKANERSLNAKSDRVSELRLEDMKFDESKKLDEVKRILSSSQQKRMSQLYRQLSISLGSANGITEFNPGWKEFLILTRDQTSELELIQRQYVADVRARPKEFTTEIVKLNYKSYNDGLKALNKKQQAILSEKLGPFAVVPEVKDK
jgi:hypothetical protein